MKIPTFLRVVIRIKAERRCINVSQQDVPCVRLTLIVRGGEHDGLRLEHLGRPLRPPGRELNEGVGIHVSDVEGTPPLAHDNAASDQFGSAESDHELAPSVRRRKSPAAAIIAALSVHIVRLGK